jgi:hypothetical protein
VDLATRLCNILQDPWHMLPSMLHALFLNHNMGDYECKTWQGENNRDKLQTKGNFTTILLY